jgi:hypothetical protein
MQMTKYLSRRLSLVTLIVNAAITLVIAAFLPCTGSAQFVFEDVTESTKIFQSCTPVADIGAGVIVLDLNNDGWEDLYLPGTVTADKLYENQKDGTFKDVTDPTFAKHNNFNSYTNGGVAFDYNKDGFVDIFEVCRRKDLLWKNNGNGTFINYSQPANIVSPFEENASNSATYGDFDGDGDNDIYVARWVNEMNAVLDSNGQSHYVFSGFPNHFYVNNSNGTFTESGMKYSIADSGTTNTTVMFDYDKDGDLDIFTGNDFGMNVSQNHVYQNQLAQTGIATFTNVAPQIGLNVGIFNMTLSPNDFDADGDFDIHQTSIGGEYLMKNNDGMFSNVAQQIGFPPLLDQQIESIPTVTWTALFSDFDNDGREDAFITHGFTKSIIETRTSTELDTSRFYCQQPDGTFKDITLTNGVVTDVRGRGAAYMDFDHDGRLDIIFGSLGRTPGVFTSDYRVFRNVTPITSDRNWLQIKAVATTTASDAIGTIVEVWTNGLRRMNQIHTNGGMSSSNSLVLHFGLGNATIADSIILYWPMSKSLHRQIDRYHNVPVNQRIVYTEQPKSSVSQLENTTQGFSLSHSVVTNSIIVNGADESITSQYEIVNILGQTLFVTEGRKYSVEIPVSTLTVGQYFVRIKSANKQQILRFIKN